MKLPKVEQIPAADHEAALVRFAGSSDLVISLGGQTDASVRKVAPRFPKVRFVEIGGPADGKPLANLGPYDPQQAQTAFLSGASAALLSEKGTVGFVGGAELPAIVDAAKEFANGAKAAKPGVRVLPPQYPGDFNDVAKARQSALADFGAGADVLGQVLNPGQKGLSQAAVQRGGKIAGGPIPAKCGSDPAYTGHARTDIGAEIEYAVAHALDGTWKAENVKFGLTADRPAGDLVVCGADAATERKLDADRGVHGPYLARRHHAVRLGGHRPPGPGHGAAADRPGRGAGTRHADRSHGLSGAFRAADRAPARG